MAPATAASSDAFFAQPLRLSRAQPAINEGATAKKFNTPTSSKPTIMKVACSFGMVPMPQKK